MKLVRFCCLSLIVFVGNAAFCQNFEIEFSFVDHNLASKNQTIAFIGIVSGFDTVPLLLSDANELLVPKGIIENDSTKTITLLIHNRKYGYNFEIRKDDFKNEYLDIQVMKKKLFKKYVEWWYVNSKGAHTVGFIKRRK